jgi:hypothetical protein
VAVWPAARGRMLNPSLWATREEARGEALAARLSRAAAGGGSTMLSAGPECFVYWAEIR